MCRRTYRLVPISSGIGITRYKFDDSIVCEKTKIARLVRDKRKYSSKLSTMICVEIERLRMVSQLILPTSTRPFLNNHPLLALFAERNFWCLINERVKFTGVWGRQRSNERSYRSQFMVTLEMAIIKLTWEVGRRRDQPPFAPFPVTADISTRPASKWVSLFAVCILMRSLLSGMDRVEKLSVLCKFIMVCNDEYRRRR